MFESLREEDKDYLESRLLTRDRAKRLSMKKVEGIFEYLMEEWFRTDVPGGGEAVRDSV
jgi:ribosome-associated toxin RatA of RatAB toxin-antitoxin module